MPADRPSTRSTNSSAKAGRSTAVAGAISKGRIIGTCNQHSLGVRLLPCCRSDLKVCRGKTLVMTTTNGIRALLWAAEAERV
jgi:hypothetical protein